MKNSLCDYPDSMKSKQYWLVEKEREYKTQQIKECMAGLIGIPILFDGNSLCPECLWHAMDIYGHTYFCKHCSKTFPATTVIDKWGQRWLDINDI